MRHLICLMVCAISIPAFAQEKTDDPHRRVREAWPKLLEAWKTTTVFKIELAKDMEAGKISHNYFLDKKVALLPDTLLKSIGQTATALDGAGLLVSDLPPELEAFKNAFKSRLSSILRIQGLSMFSVPKNQEELNKFTQEYQQVSQVLQQEYQSVYNEFYARQGGGRPAKGAAPAKTKSPVVELEEASFALLRMRENNTIEEDLEADAVAKIRKSLRELSIMDEETPQWMRNRITLMLKAVAVGDAFPEGAKSTPEIEAKVADLLNTVVTGEIAAREEAGRELCKIGEPCLAKIRAALAETTDEETKARLKRVLGFRSEKKDKDSEETSDSRPPGIRKR